MALSAHTTIQLIYGVPSLILMIFFLIALSWSKLFQNSFYRMVQFDLIINVLCYLNTWIFLRFSSEDFRMDFFLYLAKKSTTILEASNVFLQWFFHAQSLSAFFLCAQRLTTSLFIRSDEIWRKYYWLVALSGLVYSSAISLTYLLNGVDTTYEIVDGKLIIESHHMDIIALMNPVFACIYFTMIFSSGLATFCIVGKRLEVLHPMRKVLSTRKMAIITIVNSVVISGNLLYTTLYGVMTALNINALNFLSIRLMLFSSDMITLAMPWILLFLDKNVGKMLGFSKSIKTNNVQTIT